MTIALRGVALDAGNTPLLRDIDAVIAPGEFAAVLGPNGVGKTTLLRAIAGLHPPVSGSIALGGADVAALSATQRAQRVAFVTSDDVLTDALRVRDLVSVGRFAHHRWWEWRERDIDAAAIDRAIAAVGIAPLAGRLFSTLSSGERQRAWIALGLAQETPVLLLDEPTSHLDARIAHDILALLRDLAREGRTIACVLHDVNEAAAYADRIALLGHGRLLGIGTPEEVLRGTLLEAAYGIAMERVRLADGSLRAFARVTG